MIDLFLHPSNENTSHSVRRGRALASKTFTLPSFKMIALVILACLIPPGLCTDANIRLNKNALSQSGGDFMEQAVVLRGASNLGVKAVMEPLLSKLPASESLTLTTAPTKVNCGSREACEGSSADIGDNSCNIGYQSCKGTSGTIRNRCCNQASACVGSKGTINDGSCNKEASCYGIGSSAVIGKFSCNGSSGCSGTTGTIGKFSCNGDGSCYDNSGSIHDRSCNSRYACIGSSATIGIASCNKYRGCQNIRGSIGHNSCNEDDAVEVIPSGGGVKTNSVYYVTGAGLTAVDGTYNYVEAGIWECSNCALACRIAGDPTSIWGISISCVDPTGTTLGYAGGHDIYGSGSSFNAGPNGDGCSDNSDPSSCTFGRRTYWAAPIPKISALKPHSAYYVSNAGVEGADGTYNYVEPGKWECSNCALTCNISGNPNSENIHIKSYGIQIVCLDPPPRVGTHGIYGSGPFYNAGPNGGGCLDDSDPSSCTFGRRTHWPKPIPKISASEYTSGGDDVSEKKYVGGCYGYDGDFPDNCPSNQALQQGKCGLQVKNKMNSTTGKNYFSFNETIFEYVFGSTLDEKGSVFMAVHLQINEVNSTGYIKVWPANSGTGFDHPVGRLHPEHLNAEQWPFQDGDILKPASVDIAVYDRPIKDTNTSVPLGTYFTFNQAVFKDLFGSSVGIFKVAQMRGNQEMVYSGDIMVWPANVQEATIGPHPPYGRREPAGGPLFQNGDLLKPTSIKLAIYDHPNDQSDPLPFRLVNNNTKATNSTAGMYFSFDEAVWSGAAWNAVFGSTINKAGSTLNAMHLRGSRLIYSGAITVWRANSQESIAPHPPFGRRESGGIGQSDVFQEGDWLSPTTITVSSYHHPEAKTAGMYFSFDAAAFHTLFGFSVTVDPIIVKVNHMRDNEVIWTGNVRVVAAQDDVQSEASSHDLPPLGRRDPPEIAKGSFFEDGDMLQPVHAEIMTFAHPHAHPGSYFSFDEEVFASVFGSAINNDGSMFKALQLRGGSQVEYSGNIKVWPANSHSDFAPHPPFGRRDPADFREKFQDHDHLEVIPVSSLPSVSLIAYMPEQLNTALSPALTSAASPALTWTPGAYFTFNQAEFEGLFGPIHQNGTVFKVDQWRENEIVVTGNIVVWAPKGNSSTPLGRREAFATGGTFQDGDRFTPYRTLFPTRTPSSQPSISLTPTHYPTSSPTWSPTHNPTKSPTRPPTRNPTKSPTRIPTRFPTRFPTRYPTRQPTKNPTRYPTNRPTSVECKWTGCHSGGCPGGWHQRDSKKCTTWKGVYGNEYCCRYW